MLSRKTFFSQMRQNERVLIVIYDRNDSSQGSYSQDFIFSVTYEWAQ
jgi:hypothetical protein